MTGPEAPKARLAELDALRGIAALAVVVFHYTVKAPEILPRVVTVDHGFALGNYGVQLFFAISGFVIFMTVLELLVAFLQAFVFTLLSAIYFGAAIEEHDHDHHGQDAHVEEALII